ncbi:MAG: hypothetical protein A3H95_01670 [Acidobacteria bacterium RIFCSPLOWO2_02_FULL_64_15]|nr:MAG: hypothetical protein A3H95_01670 [Acidobacteria bacterium RIFCSPLOWO2_02_FULL_64_15]
MPSIACRHQPPKGGRLTSTSRTVTRATNAQAKRSITVTIKITPNDKGNPPGKLADAELHFAEGPLDGLKLIGFGIWERRSGSGRNVTFPARQYNVNGERRSFALLRPVVDVTAQNKLREMILEAFQEYEAQAAIAS